MKTLTYLLLSTLAFALPLQAQIVVLEYWDFESDSVNTDLNELINSGSINSSWNFNTPSDLTDGSGLFVLGGNSGTYTRKAPADPYSSPLTTGKYVLEVKFDSWSADTASNGDSWNIKMNDSSGNTIAGIYWEVDSASTVRLRASTSAVTGSYFRNFTGYGLTESNPVTVAVEIDFDNDTVRYLLNDVEQYSWSDFNGANIGQLSYVKNGTWGTSATSVSLEGMGYYQVVPEPAMFALIGGLAALWFVHRRRSKSGGKL